MSNKQFIVSLLILIPGGIYVAIAPFNPVVFCLLGTIALIIGLWALWAYKKIRETRAKKVVD